MEAKIVVDSILDASDFLWKSIWKKDSNNFVNLHILDSIKISDGSINSWLFTSSNGSIKNKLTNHWNIDKLLQRCNYFKDKTIMHYYDNRIHDWIIIKDANTLELYLSKEAKSNTSILCHPLLNKSSVFMEITYTKQSKQHRHIQTPHYTYNWLYTQMKTSTKNYKSSSALASHQVVCKDKEVIKLGHDYMNYLLKLIENPMNLKILGMKVIVMIVSNNSPENNIELKVTRSMYFHHIVSLSYQSASLSYNNISSGMSSMSSNSFQNNYRGTSSRSDIISSLSSLANNYLPRLSRVDCCHGDFCLYMSEEAHRNRDFYDLNGNNGSYSNMEDHDFNFKDEAYKAINRHRRYEKKSTNNTSTANDNNNGVDASNIDDELEVEHNIEDDDPSGIAKNKGATATHDITNENHSTLNFSNTASKMKKSVNNKSLLLEDLKIKSKRDKFKVMGKSIALARQEIIEIENNESLNDPNVYNNIHSNTGSPTSNSHSVSYATSMNIWPSNLRKWWLGIGQNMQKNSSSILIPDSSAHQIDKAVLATTTTIASSLNHRINENDEEVPIVHNKSSLPNNISNDGIIFPSENSSVSKVGHLSWYYSSVQVCAQCYKVYNELDRLRKLKNKHLMKKQREQLEEKNEYHWRDIEERIYKQRQFVSRISKNDDSLQKDANILGAGGHSSIFDSMTETPAGGIAFGRGFKAASGNNNNIGHMARVVIPVPNRALPPIPWNLSDSNRGEVYAKSSIGIHAKRILDKAPDKLINIPRGKESLSKSINEDGDEVDNVLKQWRELTTSNQQQQLQDNPSFSLKLRKVKSLTKTVTVETFNADRLLHPWQRELNKIKEQKRKNAIDGSNDDKKFDNYHNSNDILDEVETMYSNYDQQQQQHDDSLKSFHRSNRADGHYNNQSMLQSKIESAISNKQHFVMNPQNPRNTKQKLKKSMKSKNTKGVILPPLDNNNHVSPTEDDYTQQYTIESKNLFDHQITFNTNRPLLQSPMVFRPGTSHSDSSTENQDLINSSNNDSRTNSRSDDQNRGIQLRPGSRGVASPHSPFHSINNNYSISRSASGLDTKESDKIDDHNNNNNNNNIHIDDSHRTQSQSSPSRDLLGPSLHPTEAVNRVSNLILSNMQATGQTTSNGIATRRISSRPSMFHVESIPEIVTGNEDDEDEDEVKQLYNNNKNINMITTSTNDNPIQIKPKYVNNTTSTITRDEHDEDGDSDESDDEEIGWSPFTMAT